MDCNGRGPLPLDEKTIADRLQAANYITCQVGKWHMDPNVKDTEWVRKNLADLQRTTGSVANVPREMAAPYLPGARGFSDFFFGFTSEALANYNLDGKSLKPAGEQVRTGIYRLDTHTEAALAFIRRSHRQPFFLYLAYGGPHVPLEAPEKYLSRFPGPMPQRRRLALAMLSAIDDGVGRILDTLAEYGLDENTLIVFTSDNGAPLKITKPDDPLPKGQDGGWDGSLNDPWLGEKGMLCEGGIRVPFIVRWKRRLPAGKVYTQPVSTLDIAATAVAVAEMQPDERLDGVNLIPYLAGERQDSPHDALYWRFWRQAAVRRGPWKYLRLSNGDEYLFDVAGDEQENKDLLAAHPDIAAQLRDKLAGWTRELQPPGMPNGSMTRVEIEWFESCFRTKHVTPAGAAVKSAVLEASSMDGWLGRNCKLAAQYGLLRIEAAGPSPFITRAGLNESAPVEIGLRIRSESGGSGKLQWRSTDAKEFDPKDVVSFGVRSGDWQELRMAVPVSAEAKLAHVRIYLPAQAKPVEVAWIRLFSGAATQPSRQWTFGAENGD
jgi:arylsulfatase A-like enzyme